MGADVTVRCGMNDVYTVKPSPVTENGTGFIIYPDGWIATNGHVIKPVYKFLSIGQARARLKAKYLPKFKEVLPARKVARFYQFENKLGVATLAELAEEIPLAR